MLDSLSWGKIGASVLTGTVLTVLMGQLTPLLIALFILFFIDLITGITKGLYLQKFTSHAMRKGVGKFIAYCVSIIVAHQFAIIPLLSWVEPSLVAWLALTELASILENLRATGVKAPDINILFDMWKKLKANEKPVIDEQKENNN